MVDYVSMLRTNHRHNIISELRESKPTIWTPVSYCTITRMRTWRTNPFPVKIVEFLLQKLTLGAVRADDLHFLGTIRTLTDLRFFAGNVNDLSELQTLTKLHHLAIRCVDSFTPLHSSEYLHPNVIGTLGYLPNLRCLMLHVKIESYFKPTLKRFVDALPKLESLDIMSLYLEKPNLLRDLSALRHLKTEVDDMYTIRHLPRSLTSLHLEGTTDRSQGGGGNLLFYIHRACPNLETFECEQQISLLQLQYMPCLTSLTIRTNSKLRWTDLLRFDVSLIRLVIEDTRFSDLSCLARCRSLTSLDINSSYLPAALNLKTTTDIGTTTADCDPASLTPLQTSNDIVNDTVTSSPFSNFSIVPTLTELTLREWTLDTHDSTTHTNLPCMFYHPTLTSLALSHSHPCATPINFPMLKTCTILPLDSS